jgi:hypothetical protein
MTYADVVLLAGVGQLLVLVASALVPMRLNWKEELAGLPKLVRQLFWVYGGYVVMSIIALGVISIFNAGEIAGGGGLARFFCGYVVVFWGVRLSLQWVFDAKPFLTTWWLKAGYHVLTVMFLCFVLVYGWGVVRG